MAEGFSCSLPELDVIGEALRLNVRQFPFTIPAVEQTLEERAELIRGVERTLTEQGLVRDGELVPAVTELVGLFAIGRWSIAMLGTTGDGAANRREFCVRAGSDGRRAVLAMQLGQQVRFRPRTAPSLAHAVVGLLPPMKPGAGGSVTIAMADLGPGSRGEGLSPGGYLQRVGRGTAPAGSQLAILEAVLRQPRTGAGYFVATVRGRNGREGQPVTLTWLDTDAGRYAVVADGRGYVTCAPADRSRIEQHLVRLISTLD
jgi:hypothetical protein